MHGLVIGKFYPPHRGHKFLIETALAQVERLTVVLCVKKGQTIPAELRAAWLKEIHPQVTVRVLDQDSFNDTDPLAWTSATLGAVGEPIDCIFTSEEYGDRYAALLNCEHVLVDRERVTVPCSATEIRQNPLAYGEYLEPCVRAYFATLTREVVQ